MPRNSHDAGKRSQKDPFARAIELTERAMQVSDESHYEEGEELLREAVELVPDEEQFVRNYVEFCLQVAQNSVIAEDYAEAIAYYLKTLEHVPDAETFMDLGNAYAHNSQPLEALQAWHQALGLLGKRGKDKENAQIILENVRTVQRALSAEEKDQ